MEMIRLYSRMEIVKDEDTPNEVILLVCAGDNFIVFRSAKTLEEASNVVLLGEPNFHDSYTFSSLIVGCSEKLEEDGIVFHEVHAKITEPEPLKAFLKELRKTSLELDQDLRIIHQVDITAKFDGKIVKTGCENLSYGGMFLRIHDDELIPKAGDEITVKVHLPEPWGDIESDALVVYSFNRNSSTTLGAVPGAGVKLLFEEEQRERWIEAVNSLHKKVLNILS